MIVESLSLENIRSYRDQEVSISLPLGTILFEGDIGSGKSTILYAIEFALFGLGEMAGTYLLSEGKTQGFVRLRFLSEGRSYEVHRGLRRRKNSVSQENCYIVQDGRKEVLSPSDLKSRIIDILRFNEPSSPRAESLVYRYAVFTPQEQMKEIILRSSDERLQILRRVFGVEDYKVAADNSELLRKGISSDVDWLEGRSSGLEERENELKIVLQETQRLEKEIPTLERAEGQASEKVEGLESQYREVQESRSKIQEVAGRVPELKRSVRRLEDLVDSERRRSQELSRKVEEKKRPVEEFGERKPPSTAELSVLESKIEEMEATRMKKSELKARLLQQSEETRSLIERGICPTCGQKIEPASFGEKEEHLANEIRSLQVELDEIEKNLAESKEILRVTREYEQEKKRVQEMVNDMQELKAELKASEGRMGEYLSELDQVRIRLAQAEDEASKLEGVSVRIRQLEEELSKAEKLRSEARDMLTKARTRLEERIQKKTELQTEVEEMKAARSEMERLKNHVIWLSDYFHPTVEQIERRIMTEMKFRFNQQFQRFFSALVEDPEIRVSVNEEFSPIFERQGYEQDYAALSGGERTSIALAYRLALNVIVQQEASIGAGDLLIMDEPTDGFSKEELTKMRDILRELKCKQVILVSHERELEGMADHIYRVVKVNGTSRIEGAGGAV
jgi:exonuclease SbcC